MGTLADKLNKVLDTKSRIAATTSAITITLSDYCYNKYINDPDVVAALAAQPLVSLAQ